MRIRATVAIGIVAAAGLVARAIQQNHERLGRLVRRFRQGDLADTGAAKLKAAAELGSERLRIAVEEGRQPPSK